MTIVVKAYPSITHERNVDLGTKFAQTFLTPYRGIPAIAHSSLDADSSPIGKSRDCVWKVTAVRVRVMMTIQFNNRKIDRAFFDPDPSNPHGYEADAPREADHWRLDEANVRAHEESHAQDVVDRVETAVREALNRPGVEEQLTITAPCEDERGAYATLHRLVAQRVTAVGTEAFMHVLRGFLSHGTSSRTERRARQAQISEHDQRDDQGD